MSLTKSLMARLNYLRSHPGYRDHKVRWILRLVAWRFLSALPGLTEIELVGDVRMRIPRRWRGSSKLLYVFRDKYESELALLSRFLPRGSAMIDVGANYGCYALAAARLVGPSGHVLAIEPASEAMRVLAINRDLNDAGEIIVLCHAAAAFGLKRSRLVIQPDPGRNTLAIDEAQHPFTEEVDCVEIDVLVAEAGLSRVDLIKLDIEGAEELALRGAAATFAQHLPVVIFEVNTLAASALQLDPGGAWAILRAHGYEFFKLENHDLIPASWPIADGNVVAIPAERTA